MSKENIFVSPKDLSGRLGTKQNLYKILEIDLGLVLPSYEKCPTPFLRDIFAKKKLAIEHKNAKLLPVPRYKELGVKPIWTFIKEIPELLQYFPNLEKDELPDRSFMWTILSTLRYDECKQLICDARSARSKCDEENNGELIEIDPEFLNKLMTTPVLSAGKGRIAYLLKSSRQEKFARKKPKEFKSSLGVLKSKKEDRASIRIRSSLHEEEEKKESEEMNVDTTQRRGSASAFGDHPPPKAFSASKFASKQSKDRDEERLEF